MQDVRKMLDDLMGKTRNMVAEEREKVESAKRWDDSDICTTFCVAGFCPHNMFTNTKSDLGPCDLDHLPKMREEYLKQRVSVRKIHDRRTLQFFERVCQDAEQRKQKNIDRLSMQAKPADHPKQDEIDTIAGQVTALQEQMQTLAEAGQVEESQALTQLVEELLAKKKAIEDDKPSWMITSKDVGDLKQVCDVCGVFTESEVRNESHLMGKQHIGFAKLRKAIEDLKANLEKYQEEEKENGRDDDKDSRRRSRSRGRRDRDRRDRDRNGDRDRDRGRDRDRRERRDDRDRRDRRRDRSRSRGRGRRDRSRSRDRSRRH